MSDRVVLLTVPGLRPADLAAMPALQAKLSAGDEAVLAPSFPCLELPVTTNMATGVTCREHGVVADTFYCRNRRAVDHRPSWGDRWAAPAVWQILRENCPAAKSAVCGVPGGSDCGADVELAPQQTGTPQHLVQSTVALADQRKPDLLWCHVPYLVGYLEQCGADSPETEAVVEQLDATLAQLFAGLDAALDSPLWLVVSPYTVSSVKDVFYPNRVLREAGLLIVRNDADGEHADLSASRAWAVCDRQVSHVYIVNGEAATVTEIAELFSGQRGVAETLFGEERGKYDLVHPRSGDLIVVSTMDSWQAFDWWGSDDRAPAYTLDPGDPRNLGSDPRRLPFGRLANGPDVPRREIRGSHGAPATDESQRGAVFSSERGVLTGGVLLDTDLCDLLLRQFGV